MNALNAFDGGLEADDLNSPLPALKAELALEAAEEALLIAIQSGLTADRAIKTLWSRVQKRRAADLA